MSVILLLLGIWCVAGRLEASAGGEEIGFLKRYHTNSTRSTASGGDEAEVGFVLLTKDTIKKPIIATVDDKGILFDGRLNTSKPTKVIIHGWMDKWLDIFTQTMIASYLPAHDYNVIAVNWPEADNVLYYPSRNKVPAVGKIVGRLLDRLRNENGLNLSSVHVVGHSLGAHVGAVAGYSLKDAQIGKITALDPALPLFSVKDADALSKRAAGFVEVVHTCGHVAGMSEEIGHVDFYPNGGTPFQPGCFPSISCSHKRSFMFYSEAIKNATAFRATACSDWKTYGKGLCSKNQKVFMSGATPVSTRGKFFFKTAAHPPYGLGPHS